MKAKFNVRRYFQVLGITLGVMLVGALVCLGINYSGGLDGEEVDNTSTVEAYGGKINVLLMGTDVDGLRTDAIMLASYDTETGKVNMLSIPRDTKMYIGNRYQKINAAHAFEKNGVIGGPTATCEAVNRITGIPINYYVDFSFDAVAHVVNELGPVDFTIPDIYGDGVGMVYDDPVQGLHIDLPPGDYKLNGQQAVWVMRYRHGNAEDGTYNPATGRKEFKSYPNGDKDRIEMQQKLLKAIVDQKVNASMILKIPAIFQAVSSEIKTNFTVKDVVKYSKYLTNFSSSNIESYQLPGEFGEDKENGSVWIVDLAKTKELVRTVFGYDADNITTDNPENPKSSSSSATAKPEQKTESKSSGSTSSPGSSSSSGKSSGSSSSGSTSSSGSSSSSGKSSGNSGSSSGNGSSSLGSGSSSGNGSSSSGGSSSGSSSSGGGSSSGSSSSSGSGSSSGSSSSSSGSGSSSGSSTVESRDLESDE